MLKKQSWLAWFLLLIGALAMVAVACGDDDDDENDDDGSEATATESADDGDDNDDGNATDGVTVGIPEIVTRNEGDWPLPNGDYENRRDALNSTIDSSNADELGVAWTLAVEGVSAFGSLAMNPIVADGLVYIQDLASNVYVADAETGEVMWDRVVNKPNTGPNGVAVAYGMVYLVDGDQEIVALDAKTGDEVWTFAPPFDPNEGIDIQLLAWDGQILMSTVPGNVTEFYTGGGNGYLYSLDAETGEENWNFDTIDSEDIWGDLENNSGGGAWYPPAVDTETGETYWGIGNPGPYPGTEEFPGASSRPGDNLYTDSLLKMSADGELVWYDQVKPHDLFDLDFQSSPILDTVEVDGEDVEIVIGSGKTGYVIGWDRESGERLWTTEVGTHLNDDVQELGVDEELEVFPGSLGGVETPMAYRDGVVYVPLLNMSTTYNGFSTVAGFDFANSNGELLAIDAATGEIIWQVEQPSPNFGGATLINDLVFTSTFDGHMYLYDIETGDVVWDMAAPNGINASPAVVGDTIYIPMGVGAVSYVTALRLGADGDYPEPPAVEEPTEPTEIPGEGEGFNGIVVTADDLSFDASEFTVEAGEVSVSFTNEDTLPHDFTVYADGDYTEEIAGSGILVDEGSNSTFTFEAEAGSTLYFRCVVHPSDMAGGTITVQ